MKIILYKPQIPQNTGNIIRSCYATNTDLAIVEPTGFSLSNRQLKRSGLDYYLKTPVERIDDLAIYLENTSHPFYFFSSKATTCYYSVDFSDECMMIFGSETEGLPDYFFDRWPENFVTLPMPGPARCLNLSNAVAVAIYEKIRQDHLLLNKEKNKVMHMLATAADVTGKKRIKSSF